MLIRICVRTKAGLYVEDEMYHVKYTGDRFHFQLEEALDAALWYIETGHTVEIIQYFPVDTRHDT